MANINEEARIPVYINDEQAKSALKNLQNEADKWRKKMFEAMEGGDLKGMKDAEREMKKAQRAMGDIKREAFDVNKVLQNISNASLKDLKAALRAVDREMEGLNRSSKQYQALMGKKTDIRTELSKINGVIREQPGFFSRAADSANKYFGIIAAAGAAFTGVVLGLKQVVQASNDYEERVDNLSALTGLAGDNLEWLSQKAKDLSTSTLEGGIRVKQGAQEIVDAFTKVGSARPELLKDKEALEKVTEEAIILSNAAKTDLQPAVEGLTMMLNQFNGPATDARRIINAMAAGSKEGAGEIPYLTAAVEKSGTVAADAGLSYETLIATIETLAPKITQPEIAGRSLKGVLLDLQNGADDTNPAIVGMATALENLGKKNLSITELTKRFGVENITTAKILIDNVGELKRYEAAVTDTNVAIEQASINTDNNNAKLAQARNRINVVSIELGEKLSPAMTVATGWFGKSLVVLSYLVDVITKFSGVIISTTSAIVGYTVATKLATVWETRNNEAKGLGLVLTKLKVFWHGAERGALLLSAAAQALLTGNITRATAAMRVFNATTKMNPIGLLVGILAAGVVALAMYSRGLTAAQQAQKAVNEVNIEAQKAMVEEKLKIEQLLKIAKNEKLSKDTRLKAIKDLNAISPEYLGNLTLEKINTDEAKKSTDLYIESIKKKAKAAAGFQKLVDIEKELIDLQNGEGADSSFWQDAWNLTTSFGNAAVYAGKTTVTALANIDEKTKALLETKKKLSEQMDKDNTAGSAPGGKPKDEKQAQDLIKLKEEELKNINEEIAATPALVKSRNERAEAKQKEIDALKELGTKKEGKSGEKASDEAIKKSIEDAEADYAKKLALLKKNHLESKGSEDQYNADLLQAEFNFLQKKLTIYKVGSKEYEETQAQILEKQVAAEQTVKDLLLKAQNELDSAKIENLQDGIEKEKATEKQRWTEEKTALKKQLIEHENLSNDEIALNDAIHKIIEEKEAAHQEKMRLLNSAGDIKETQKKSDKLGEINSFADQYAESTPFLSLELLASYFDERRSLITEQYQLEKKLAGKNKDQLEAVEKKYILDMNNLKRQEVDVAYDVSLRKIGIAQQYLQALSGIVDQQSDLGKALFLFEQGLAIASIWISTAKANAKAVAELVLPPLWGPVVAANTVYAGVETGLVLAQTVANFVKGKAEGGYTAPGSKYTPAGIVHAGEYVIPQEGVYNAQLRPVIDLIEIARRNGSLARLDLRPVVASIGTGMKGYSGGGPAGASSGSRSASPTIIPSPGLSDAVALKLIKGIDQLVKLKLEVDVRTFKRGFDLLEKYEDGGLK